MEGLETRDGRRLAYRRTGEGPVLVCHGGGPGFSSLYLGDLAGLGDELELVLLDPRGTGGSAKPTQPRANAIEDNYPQRVERLILASTLARFSPEQEAAMAASVEAHADEPWYEDARAALEAEEAGDFETDEELAELSLREFPFYFARYGDDERAYVERLRGDTPNADALRLFNQEQVPSFDLRPELARIAAPTLVITGEEDFITGPLSAAELSEGIAGAETVLVPGCGHFIFVETREAFRDSVLAFLGAGARA